MRALYAHGGVSGRDRADISIASMLGSGREGAALDAVETVVRNLEDHPDLNAGFGAVLNRSGEIESDAGIADGATGNWAGAVSVSVRHPISLARRVLEDTPHVLMSGSGAMALASGRSRGLEYHDRRTVATMEEGDRRRFQGLWSTR